MSSTLPGGFEETPALVVLREVGRGLAYMHKHGTLHRNLKSSSILIDAEGDVRLADFGFSTSLYRGGELRSKATTFVGSHGWMAPEVLEQASGYDAAADIWSFGITAIELTRGAAPYAGMAPLKVMLRVLHSDPPIPAEAASSGFKELVAACVQHEPTGRPTASRLLTRAVLSALGDAPSGTWLRPIIAQLPPLHERCKAARMQPVAAAAEPSAASHTASPPTIAGEPRASASDEAGWDWELGEGTVAAVCATAGVTEGAAASSAGGIAAGAATEGAADVTKDDVAEGAVGGTAEGIASGAADGATVETAPDEADAAAASETPVALGLALASEAIREALAAASEGAHDGALESARSASMEVEPAAREAAGQPTADAFAQRLANPTSSESSEPEVPGAAVPLAEGPAAVEAVDVAEVVEEPMAAKPEEAREAPKGAPLLAVPSALSVEAPPQGQPPPTAPQPVVPSAALQPPPAHPPAEQPRKARRKFVVHGSSSNEQLRELYGKLDKDHAAVWNDAALYISNRFGSRKHSISIHYLRSHNLSR
ncbi:hypothetical protein Ctob_005716 [Chrysochromulina tobinii]|uniref:Protein kinase domain-containing protein n=1 Tax=Chrysochromulina tobinii TaxID=1460289 RepID=A0A0M0J7F5_9EUKA|nr:hypothetical protein Ctob_005716 [Chrysochromulina tobinii]|eukprot:KOO22287.1 hypothetical protein Ctob_005716 [Chrysochromulina sp. CCMP291]